MLSIILPVCAMSMNVDRGEVLRIIDGDTVEVRLDVGYGFEIHDKARIYGINAPERYTPEGPVATSFLASMAPVGSAVYVERMGSDGRDKYGRLLIKVYTPACKDVGAAMLDAGQAVPYKEG